MDKQKLLIFYYGHDDFRYGVAEVFRAVLLGIDRKRYHPILVYGGSLSPKAVAKLSSVDLYQLHQDSLKKSIWPLFKLLKKVHPAILMTGTEHANIVCSMIKLMLFGRIGLVLSVHSPLSLRFREMWSKNESRYLRALICFFYRFADQVVCVSEYVKQDLALYTPSANSCVIYNPVKINEDLQLINRKNKSIRMLIVSRLVANKCIEDLIYLVQRNRSIEQLDIVGDGPFKSDLEGLARRCGVDRRVVFHGYVDDPADYYLRAEIFVLPSRWEGFGNVLVEAMSYGCQVIVNQGAGAPVEIIGDGEYGFIYEQGNINSLQEAFDACIDRPMSALKLFKHARNFRSEGAVKRYEQLFDNILTNKRFLVEGDA